MDDDAEQSRADKRLETQCSLPGTAEGLGFVESFGGEGSRS